MRLFQTLEGFLHEVPAGEGDGYQQRLLSQYLSCSGLTLEDNRCLDRVVCEYGAEGSQSLRKEDRDVISM